MQSSVSVIVPTYNRADILAETLDSILSQTRPPSEVIVVDDGSTDNTRDVVAGYGTNVQYHLAENGGSPRARNIGASFATSEYFAFCDDDDLWRKDKLEQQMELHESDREMHYSFTNFSLVVNGTWLKKTEFDHAPDKSFAPYFPLANSGVVLTEPFYDQLLTFQPIRPSAIILSSRLFHGIGGFAGQFGRTRSEDVEFALRCVQHPPIGVIRDAVVGIRQHSKNISGDSYKVLQGQVKILEYARSHHSINEGTRDLLTKAIELRRIDASYHAFRRGEFEQVVSLIEDLAASSLDLKTRVKYWISKMPFAAAKAARRLLLKRS